MTSFKIMTSFRLVFVTFLTIAYGMSQLFCACLSVANASPPPANESLSHHTMMVQTSHHGMKDGSQRLNHYEHSRGDENPACEHCENQGYITATNDGADFVAPSLSLAVKLSVIMAVMPPQSRPLVMNSLSGLGWLDPPDITPITLKIRMIA